MKGHFEYQRNGLTIEMSVKEIDQLPVIKKLAAQEIKVSYAARTLGLSSRQILRIKKRYQEEGTQGLIHKSRGKPSKRKISQEEITRIMDIVKTNYADFGPTFALEKLKEHHGVFVSRETLRKVMITQGLWHAKKKKALRVYQMRERRSRLGELVQADGSPHPWFEDRADSCTLLVFIDDATGNLMYLQFVKTETTNAYFEGIYIYITNHGKPLALYVDRHSVFKTTRGIDEVAKDTQFTRAMRELSIEVICANSPQAKGRVEKVNRTLQERLVKEMRLLGISNMEEGNTYLPTFISDFNRKFAVEPRDVKDAHLPLLTSESLDDILVKKEVRILSKNLTFGYKSNLFQVSEDRPSYALRYAPVEVREGWDEKVRVYYKGKELHCRIFERQPYTKVINSKELTEEMKVVVSKRAVVIPKANHPWRKFVI